MNEPESTDVVDSSSSPLSVDALDSASLTNSLLDMGLVGFTDLNSVVLSADLAMTLCRHAAPKGESEGKKCSVPERARASGAIIVDLLKAMHKGKLAQEQTGAKCAFSDEGGQALCELPSSLAAPIYIFATTHHEDKPWTDHDSRAKAQEVLACLLWTSRAGSVAELLRGRGEADQGIFKDVMGLLKPELKKDTWELNPATKYIFSWTLQQVIRPWLSDYLDSVLPPSLLLSDDFRTENKILGVRCLHHIILNVPAAELLQCNRAQVVYHALYNHLYTPEADLIQVVLSCLLDLLPVLDKFSRVTRDPGQRHQHTNDVLQLIVTHMEMEHKILLRRVYANYLPAFVERLNPSRYSTSPIPGIPNALIQPQAREQGGGGEGGGSNHWTIYREYFYFAEHFPKWPNFHRYYLLDHYVLSKKSNLQKTASLKHSGV
ncbi:TELO2-interacting protein 2 isoform X2 [Pleurodeles waltl]|uniref:TELO2-interacting protein 2 isoform X2 n=1 Tax=Pleurodeles waltl TaxID=8319 RepID=UPI00370955E3